MRLIRALASLLLLAGLALAAWVYLDYRRFSDAPLALGDGEERLMVPLGTPFPKIVAELRRRGLTGADPLYWRALAYEMDVAQGLHAGEYALTHGLTPRGLLAKMARGDVVQHRFTIVEGWSFRELRAALARDEGLEQTLAGVDDAELMRRLDAEDQHPEGRFLPETYAYTRGDRDVDVLRRAHAAMRAALDEAWSQRRPDTPLANPDEALILASIVEKETGAPAERAQIAGVFVRRLKLGMKLQTDPTVIYGLGSAFAGNLTRAHLEADTPYNTYTRTGLPPTPIALPGREALKAATQPADGDALFFVSRGDGTHEFSATLDAHNAAVARWQLRRGR